MRTDGFTLVRENDVTQLKSAAREVLGQLFVNGPTYDGNVASKIGRDELVAAGLAEHRAGWAYLTTAGVKMAASADLSRYSGYEAWRRKKSCR